MKSLTTGRKTSIGWWFGILLLGTLVFAGCGTSNGGYGGSAGGPATTATTPTAPSSTSPASGAGGTQVKITEQGGKYGFSPTTLTVAKGTKVVWTNASDAPHTVTSDTGTTLASSTIDPSGGTFSFTFTQPGTYSYHCTIHPYMKGTITVTG